MKVYNTLNRKKEEFKTKEAGKVGMYVCGVTVYDVCHIGHARSAVAFDVIARYLRKKGYKLNYVKNITDVDDKIIKKSQQLNISAKEVAQRYIKEYQEDMQAIGVLPPDIEPLASEHIDEMIILIEKLIQNHYAYEVQGNVYFSVKNFPGYGKLSGRSLDEMEAGARIEIDERKLDPLDFALWKAAKPKEPYWNSPWGKGRPGWHIECSAMSLKYLKPGFEIHGGATDLIFPHHENEIAQSEAAEKTKFVQYWIHNGLINFNQEKMSKSLGNFFTIKEILQRYEPEALRLFFLQSHYRRPINIEAIYPCPKCKSNLEQIGFRRGICKKCQTKFQPEELWPQVKLPALEEAEQRIIYFYETLLKIETILKQIKKEIKIKDFRKIESKFKENFFKAMDDDFNTALGLAHLGEGFRKINELINTKSISPEEKTLLITKIKSDLKELTETLGIIQSPPKTTIEKYQIKGAKKKGVDPEWIQEQIRQRNKARLHKNWALADAIREKLLKAGIELRDLKNETIWRVIK